MDAHCEAQHAKYEIVRKFHCQFELLTCTHHKKWILDIWASAFPQKVGQSLLEADEQLKL